jgi:phosphatidylinositol 4-kinase B
VLITIRCSRYADHVGIHYVLCSKLRQFSYEEIEFFLPQLCHLIISVNNESMALEEFILDLCEESVNGALLVCSLENRPSSKYELILGPFQTFWLFQTYLHDFSNNPQSEQFKTCRRIYNKVQHIVFGVSDSSRSEKIKENVMPVTVLASFVLSSVAVPLLPQWAGPLAIAQARKPQPNDDVISDASQTQNVVRSHTVASSSARPRRVKDGSRVGSAPNPNTGKPEDHQILQREPSLTRPRSSGSTPKSTPETKRPPHLTIHDAQLSSTSLPLPEIKSPRIPRSPRRAAKPTAPTSVGTAQHSPEQMQRRHARIPRALTPSALNREQKIKLLRQNYFRCETQFLTALEDISNRLVLVPKPARLSALRAELALIDQDLPAEVDIPVICPATLIGGIPSNSRHHRIVRISPAECTVLNSAEKVPYLLMVEVLREDFSFNPENNDNEKLIARLLTGQGTGRRRIFDLSESPRAMHSNSRHIEEQPADSVFEPIQGDLGSSPLLKALDGDERPKENGKLPSHPPRLSSGATTLSTLSSLPSPRTSGTSTSRSSSPAPLRKMTHPMHGRGSEQPDFSALATHMRTASQMLAQLELTSGKRPKHEVAAIRAKIIASMQSLEEQSFESDESPTFDLIMANASAAAAQAEAEDMDGATELETLNPGAGAARMENDQKTGGVQRKGDRDDPSAATFGEAWSVKKERIRKASPYGWMKNWDLVSVIVKTGADLRQEAFAVQLINVCNKIWRDAGTPVWVKRMRILVTGESSGLIETITNGVSLHSLKRSLTLATIASGQNPRGRIATLKDHFVKTFGSPDADTYKAAEDAFRRSLAAYSIISYILQLKDRHNGNVLIDNEGHIIHIDFGFMLSNSPGSVGFEAAPFKLTQDYVDVLGGVNSQGFENYKTLCKRAFQGQALYTATCCSTLANLF